MPERYIESLGAMGWGVGLGNSSVAAAAVAAAAVAPPEWVFFGETVSSRLGLRTEISARYRLQMNPTGGPHLFCFHENVRLCEKINPIFCGKFYQIFCEKIYPIFCGKIYPIFCGKI